MELPNQKGFYDSRRQFQGHDSPRAGEGGSDSPSLAPPRGQVIAGGIFLLLIVLAFLKFAPPPKPVGIAPAAPAPAPVVAPAK